jgi:hypothetical protein
MLLLVSLTINHRRSQPPDVDNVKGGALAARFSSAPKTSVLSNKLIRRGLVPRFFVVFRHYFAVPGGGSSLATAADLRRLALALPGTASAPHFDRTAFKVDRIFVTLAADALTANIRFTPDEQEFKCQLAPEIFRPLDNAWGRQGWTAISLGAATEDDLRAALAMAHRHAVGKPVRKRT